jgi:hypothetical protein
MRVEDPVNRRGGLKLGSVLIMNQNLYFEMASSVGSRIMRFNPVLIVGIERDTHGFPWRFHIHLT